MILDGEKERTSEGSGVRVRCGLLGITAFGEDEKGEDGFRVRTLAWDWHPGLEMIPPRRRSSTGMASIERSRLVLSLSFTISSPSSFAFGIIKRSHLGVEPQSPNQPTQFGVSLEHEFRITKRCVMGGED